MAVATLAEPELVPVQQLCVKIIGKRVAPGSIWRWTRKGAHGVKLTATMVLGCWHATEDDFRAFLAGQTEAALADSNQPAERSPATERRLRKAGLID